MKLINGCDSEICQNLMNKKGIIELIMDMIMEYIITYLRVIIFEKRIFEISKKNTYENKILKKILNIARWDHVPP